MPSTNWSIDEGDWVNAAGNPDVAGITELLDQRQKRYESLMFVVEAVGGELEGQIARILMDGTDDTIPDYRLIGNGPERDDAKCQTAIQRIKDTYNIDNDISPLRKLDREDVDLSSRALIERIYFKGKDEMIMAVGETPDFISTARQILQASRNQVRKELRAIAPSGYNRLYEDATAGVLMGKYGVDPADINADALKAHLPKVIQDHVEGKIKGKYFERNFPVAPAGGGAGGAGGP
jgi:hypothetical protein